MVREVSPTRRFGGKVYRFILWRRTKQEAQREAKECRELAKFKARIVPMSDGYAIYIRFGNK